MMLRAYFDDSGSHASSAIVVMGGLIGTVAQWARFEDAWAAKLACPLTGKPPLKAFHLAACRAGKDEFAGYNDAERDAVTHDFRRIIIDAKLTSTSSAVDRIAWDELVTGNYRKILGSALEVCFNNCIARIMSFAGGRSEPNKIEIVFDQGIKSDSLREIADLYMRQVGGNPWVCGVTFARVQAVLPLQGADMVATESYWHGQLRLTEGEGAVPRAHLRHHIANMLSEGLIFDREAIVAELRRRGPDGRVLEEQSS